MMEYFAFMIIGFIVIGLLWIAYEYINQLLYLQNCTTRKGIIVGRVRMSRARSSYDAVDEGIASDSLDREYFYNVIVRFPIRKGEEVEKKCYDDLPSVYEIGREVTVTYKGSPKEIHVDYEERSRETIKNIAFYTAILIGIYLVMTAFGVFV